VALLRGKASITPSWVFPAFETSTQIGIQAATPAPSVLLLEIISNAASRAILIRSFVTGHEALSETQPVQFEVLELFEAGQFKRLRLTCVFQILQLQNHKDHANTSLHPQTG